MPVTHKEGDRYPLNPPNIMKTNYRQFDQKYAQHLFENWSAIDIDMFKYLCGTDFSMSSLKKAK